jgi:hypothetical protein
LHGVALDIGDECPDCEAALTAEIKALRTALMIKRAEMAPIEDRLAHLTGRRQ